jgi:hypothetical protein
MPANVPTTQSQTMPKTTFLVSYSDEGKVEASGPLVFLTATAKRCYKRSGPRPFGRAFDVLSPAAARKFAKSLLDAADTAERSERASRRGIRIVKPTEEVA